LNKTAKNTAIYFAGTVIMAVFGFINTMLLTRVLDEQVYAMYGLLHNFVTTVVMFISFGYDTAYSRFYYQHNQPQNRFLVKSMLVPIGLFVVFTVVLVEPRQHLVQYIFGDRFSAIAILLLLCYIFFSFVHRFTQLTARMEERAFNYVASSFIGRFGFVIIVFIVFLLWNEVGFDWILWSSLIGAAGATLINLWVMFAVRLQVNDNGGPIGHREMMAYGFPHMINSVLILAIPLIEKLIVRDLAGWEILGIYTAAAVFQTVVSMVTLTVNNIWNPLVFKHCDQPVLFKPILHSFGNVITVIIVSGFSLCVLLRRWLVLILDRSYFNVYIIAPAICFGACLTLLSVIYASGINIVKKTIHHVVEPILQMIFSLVCCHLFIPPLGLVGVGIAVLISVVLSRIYKMIVGLHLYDTGASEHKMWILMGLCTAVAFASLFLTSFIADLVMFIVLIVAMLLVLNKDLITVVNTAKTLLIPKKKSKENEVQE